MVQAEALDLASAVLEPQVPQPLTYLSSKCLNTWDVQVFADVMGSSSEWTRMSASSLKCLRWTATQMVAHHSVNGCVLRAGDVLGTGTISGPVGQS